MMASNLINIKELYYLAEYKDITSIFGIDFQQPDEETRYSLIKKGILDKIGNVNHVTYGYVEMLNKYCHAKEYLHIQQYLFGIQEDNLCIIIKQVIKDEELLYEILVGDILTLFQIAMQHPIIKIAAKKYYKEMNQGKTSKEFELPLFFTSATLVIEHFDNLGELISKLVVGYQENKYYSLNDKLEFDQEIKAVDSFLYLVKALPKVTKVIESILKEDN